MQIGRWAFAIGAAATVAGCILFTDTGGFSEDDGKTPADSGTDTSVADTKVDEVVVAVDSGDAGDTGDAAFDGPWFHDDFARADSPVVGNGWIEKTPDVFGILGGAAVKAEAGAGFVQYHDALVYRPQGEDRADVEVSAVIVLGTGIQFPQVFVRAQRSTVTTPMAYEAYILFLTDLSEAKLARQRGPMEETDFAGTTLPQLVAGQRIRLTLRATGEMPVKLEAFVDRIEAGIETRLGSLMFSDDTVDRLSTPGATGFTAAYDTTVSVDDFAWRALSTR